MKNFLTIKGSFQCKTCGAILDNSICQYCGMNNNLLDIVLDLNKPWHLWTLTERSELFKHDQAIYNKIKKEAKYKILMNM